MKKRTVTVRYDVAEHLRTPEEMAAYLEACLEEADGDAAFVATALGDIARAKGMSQVTSIWCDRPWRGRGHCDRHGNGAGAHLVRAGTNAKRLSRGKSRCPPRPGT